MRVAMVACSAPVRTAVGNLLAEKVAFFVDREAEVRVFLESTAHLHPQLHSYVERCPEVPTEGQAWNYLCQCDLVFFELSQGFDLLSLLPLLVPQPPRASRIRRSMHFWLRTGRMSCARQEFSTPCQQGWLGKAAAGCRSPKPRGTPTPHTLDNHEIVGPTFNHAGG